MSERVLCAGAKLSDHPGLTGLARNLAGPEGFVAVLVAPPATASGSAPAVDEILTISTPDFDSDRGDHFASAILAGVRAVNATIVLAGPTKVEREGLARAGGCLDAPVLTGVRSPRVSANGVDVSRDLLSGNAVGVEHATGRPVLLSLADEPPIVDGTSPRSAAPERATLDVVLPAYPFRRVSMEPKAPRGVDLEAADRIVSVGKGLQKKEDLALIEGLAATLGAAVGCTRPLAAESGWLSDAHWVGLTGHRVRPTLYIAVGISGAAQHLVGMRDSKVVVAINKDPNAPIFQQADFQVVGDLYTIVPELTRRLASARAPR